MENEAILTRLKDFLPEIDVERLRMYSGLVGDLSATLTVAEIVKSYNSTDHNEEIVESLLRAWVKLHFAEVEIPRLQGSGSLDKLMQWEKMSLSGLISVLVKWFSCDCFTLTVDSRPSVATRIWYTLKFELPEHYGHESKRTRYISASSAELLRERLIKCLDREELCKTRIEQKQNELRINNGEGD